MQYHIDAYVWQIKSDRRYSTWQVSRHNRRNIPSCLSQRTAVKAKSAHRWDHKTSASVDNHFLSRVMVTLRRSWKMRLYRSFWSSTVLMVISRRSPSLCSLQGKGFQYINQFERSVLKGCPCYGRSRWCHPLLFYDGSSSSGSEDISGNVLFNV